MSKGLKRICMDCGMRFYDMDKDPIICPSCETVFTGEIKVKSRRGRVAAAVEEAAPVKEPEKKEPEKEEEDKDVADIDADDDIVSLDDEDEDDDLDDEDDDTLLPIEDDDLDDNLDDLDDDQGNVKEEDKDGKKA